MLPHSSFFMLIHSAEIIFLNAISTLQGLFKHSLNTVCHTLLYFYANLLGYVEQSQIGTVSAMVKYYTRPNYSIIQKV